MERMKALTTAEKERMKDEEFQNKIQQNREQEEKKTDKKRKKRQKHKEAKLRRKMLAKAGVKLGNDNADDGEGDSGDDDNDDFAVPAPENEGPKTSPGETSKGDAPAKSNKEEESSSTKPDASPAPPFPNDGSFLEMMKRQLEGK